MSASESNRSPSDKLRLWRQRGLCPNRKELIGEFFTPVFDTKAQPNWLINVKFEKDFSEHDEVQRLPHLFISDSKKVFFLPPKSPLDFTDDITGYMLLIRRGGQDCGELLSTDLKLYPFYWEDILNYFPEPSKYLYKNRDRTFPISKLEFRFISGKWRRLLHLKQEKDDYVIFKTTGFTRLKYQTTGKVWGSWDELEG